jgi:hypothetical protein
MRGSLAAVSEIMDTPKACEEVYCPSIIEVKGSTNDRDQQTTL